MAAGRVVNGDCCEHSGIPGQSQSLHQHSKDWISRALGSISHGCGSATPEDCHSNCSSPGLPGDLPGLSMGEGG